MTILDGKKRWDVNEKNLKTVAEGGIEALFVIIAGESVRQSNHQESRVAGTRHLPPPTSGCMLRRESFPVAGATRLHKFVGRILPCLLPQLFFFTFTYLHTSVNGIY